LIKFAGISEGFVRKILSDGLNNQT
jgi:hypothetical protein